MRLILILLLTLFAYADDLHELDTFKTKLRVGQIFYALNNGSDFQDGSSYMVSSRYISDACFGGISMAGGLYVVGDSGLGTGVVDTGNYLGLASSPQALNYTLGELYLNFKNGDLNIRSGKQQLITPLTAQKSDFVPNFYNGTYLRSKHIENFELGLYWISELNYGSNSINDYSFIGGNTTSAGASPLALTKRSTFVDVATLAGNTASQYGLIALSMESSAIAYTKIGLWDYYQDRIINITYLDQQTKIPLGELFRTILATQFLYQLSLGSSTYDTALSSHGGLIYGAKLGIEARKGNGELSIAYTNSGSTRLFNPYGGDPLWTSSYYTRNGYREGVWAAKALANYKHIEDDLLKGAFLEASYGYYGKSSFATALNDATEIDVSVGYELKDYLYAKYQGVVRTGEDSKTMNNHRVVVGLGF